MPPETTPGFSVKQNGTIKLPLTYLVGLISLTISSTAMWMTLLARCAHLEEALTEERRVNAAQDHRFENLEASQADLPVIRNDMKWLLRKEEARRP